MAFLHPAALLQAPLTISGWTSGLLALARERGRHDGGRLAHDRGEPAGFHFFKNALTDAGSMVRMDSNSPFFCA